MSASLVGSEMCIRDRLLQHQLPDTALLGSERICWQCVRVSEKLSQCRDCLLYTSDAADDM
eukprot:286061-Alexandrium_andersonii.AAC.1